MAGRGVVTIERLADLDELLGLLRRHGVSRARLGEMEFDLESSPARQAPTPGDSTPTVSGDVPPASTSGLSAIPRTDPLFDAVEGIR